MGVVSPPDGEHLGRQLLWLVVLALPIATVAWSVTHEEIFREWRERAADASLTSKRILSRKFFYVFTCEYCFSHYVSALALAATGYRLLLDDWRGLVIALFSLVAIANLYMSLFARVRVDIKAERLEIAVKERQVQETGGTAPEP